MFAFFHGSRRGEGPRAFCIGFGTADFNAIVVDDNGRVCRCLTADDGAGFVGDVARTQLAGLAAGHIEHGLDGRRVGRGEQNRQVPGQGFRRLVANAVGGGDGEAMAAGIQVLGRGECPISIVVGRYFTDLLTVVIDGNAATGFGETLERGSCIVGTGAIDQGTGGGAEVIDGFKDFRLRRRQGVDGDGVAGRAQTAVAGEVDRGGAERVGAVRQAVGQGDVPYAFRVRVGGCHQCRAIVDGDHRVGFGGTRQGRGVVAGLAILGDDGEIVGHAGDEGRRRCNGVDDQHQIAGSPAGFRITDEEQLATVVQFGVRHIAPVALPIDLDAADDDAVLQNFQCGAGLAGTYEFRLVIVSDVARSKIALLAADEVIEARDGGLLSDGSDRGVQLCGLGNGIFGRSLGRVELLTLRFELLEGGRLLNDVQRRGFRLVLLCAQVLGYQGHGALRDIAVGRQVQAVFAFVVQAVEAAVELIEVLDLNSRAGGRVRAQAHDQVIVDPLGGDDFGNLFRVQIGQYETCPFGGLNGADQIFHRVQRIEVETFIVEKISKVHWITSMVEGCYKSEARER